MIYAATLDRVKIPGPSQSHGELTLHEGYEVQARVIAKRCEAGERQLGWKVGADRLDGIAPFDHAGRGG